VELYFTGDSFDRKSRKLGSSLSRGFSECESDLFSADPPQNQPIVAIFRPELIILDETGPQTLKITLLRMWP
jgi:hypothetical protein